MSNTEQLDKQSKIVYLEPFKNFETKYLNNVQLFKTIKIIETLEKEADENPKIDDNDFNHLIAYFVFDLLDYVRKNYSDYSFSKNIIDFEEKLTKNFEIGDVHDDE